ncbi:MAG TPA: hypothetical protein PLX15_04340 [Candidatus Woesearchaeota archaeon]|nr:hypothetical protein [Candidatus Woesearchaeota archaeon]
MKEEGFDDERSYSILKERGNGRNEQSLIFENNESELEEQINKSYSGNNAQRLIEEMENLDSNYGRKKPVDSEENNSNTLLRKIKPTLSFQGNLELIQTGLLQSTQAQNELNKKYRMESSVIGRMAHIAKQTGYKIIGKDYSLLSNSELIKKEMEALEKIIDGIEGVYHQSTEIVNRTRGTREKQLNEKSTYDKLLIQYREERVARQKLGEKMVTELKNLSNMEVDSVYKIRTALMNCQDRLKDLDSMILENSAKSRFLTTSINDLNRAIDVMLEYKNTIVDMRSYANNAYSKCKTISPFFGNIEFGSKVSVSAYKKIGELSNSIALLWSKTFSNIGILSKIAGTAIPTSMYDEKAKGEIGQMKDAYNNKKYSVFEEVERHLASTPTEINFDYISNDNER